MRIVKRFFWLFKNFFKFFFDATFLSALSIFHIKPWNNQNKKSRFDGDLTGGHMKKFNPGDIAPKTGYYKVTDARGKTLDKVSVNKGDRLPPTQSSDYYYEFDS